MIAAGAVALSATPLRVEPATDGAEWDAYVESHPSGTACHLWAWREIFRDAFGRDSTYLAVRGGDGRLAGVLPIVWFDHAVFGRFGVSVPFLNYGGVLADGPVERDALLERAADTVRQRGAAHLELRHTARLLPTLPCKSHKVAMRLPLRGTETEQWEALDRKVRNQVRKADKNELTVLTGGADLLDDFYTVFARNMRDLGTPVYARRFFEDVCARFPSRSTVFAVRWREQPIAASMVIAYKAGVEVPWASSLREHNHLCANVRLYWEMLRHAVGAGATSFDFGRSTPNEGTFHFKRQWGAEPVALQWEYWLREGATLPDLSPKNPKFSALITVWQRLPVWVTTAIGPPIVRHIP